MFQPCPAVFQVSGSRHEKRRTPRSVRKAEQAVSRSACPDSRCLILFLIHDCTVICALCSASQRLATRTRRPHSSTHNKRCCVGRGSSCAAGDVKHAAADRHRALCASCSFGAALGYVIIKWMSLSYRRGPFVYGSAILFGRVS